MCCPQGLWNNRHCWRFRLYSCTPFIKCFECWLFKCRRLLMVSEMPFCLMVFVSAGKWRHVTIWCGDSTGFTWWTNADLVFCTVSIAAHWRLIRTMVGWHWGGRLEWCVHTTFIFWNFPCIGRHGPCCDLYFHNLKSCTVLMRQPTEVCATVLVPLSWLTWQAFSKFSCVHFWLV